jgi:endonuclease/exonuclease/phosphatase family metal-dependent hydrolase
VRSRILALPFALLVAVAVPACSDDNDLDFGPSVTLADLNFLHGIFCPPASDRCRLPDRVELLLDFIVERGCPDVVTLQEIWPPTVELLEPRLANLCSTPYELVQGPDRPGVDDETILTRHPVLEVEQIVLYRGFRRALRARVDHPIGPLDVYTSHLASGSDGAREPCGDDCPAACVQAGAATVRDCQAVQMASFVAATHDVPEPALVTGDFNETPGSFVYEQFAGRGWTDVYLAAGNPECDPATGVGCTSGRADEELAGLESPALNERVRIDFIFLVPPQEGSRCPRPRLDPANDPDGDGTGTRLFADVPNPFAESCGPLPAPICWPSDHIGVQVDFDCG